MALVRKYLEHGFVSDSSTFKELFLRTINLSERRGEQMHLFDSVLLVVKIWRR